MEKNVDRKRIPLNDKQRVESLKRYNILNTPPEKSFDNLAKLATKFFDLPIALISFVDTENVFLKASIGIEGYTNSPRKDSLCALAILSEEVTVFEDLPNVSSCILADPGLVGELGFRFYAGAPITDRNGMRIGTMCVIGKDARTFSVKEAEMLKSFAQIAMDEIELRLQGILQAEREFANSRHLMHLEFNDSALIYNAPVAIAVLTGPDLIITLANIKVLDIWQKTDAVLGKPIAEALPELAQYNYLELLQTVYDSGVAHYGYEEPIAFVHGPSTKEVYMNFIYQPIKDIRGKTVSIMVVATEITEQTNARKDIELSEKRLNDMFAEQKKTNELLKKKIEELKQYLLNLTGISPE